MTEIHLHPNVHGLIDKEAVLGLAYASNIIN